MRVQSHLAEPRPGKFCTRLAWQFGARPLGARKRGSISLARSHIPAYQIGS